MGAEKIEKRPIVNQTSEQGLPCQPVLSILLVTRISSFKTSGDDWSRKLSNSDQFLYTSVAVSPYLPGSVEPTSTQIKDFVEDASPLNRLANIVRSADLYGGDKRPDRPVMLRNWRFGF